MGALEISRLDMVRGFLGAGAKDAPPARLAFYSKPEGSLSLSSNGLPLMAELLRVGMQASKHC